MPQVQLDLGVIFVRCKSGQYLDTLGGTCDSFLDQNYSYRMQTFH